MLNFEHEIAELPAADRLLPLERREVFSIYPELRVMSWGGVMLIVAGVGVLISKNLDRIGPVLLATAIAVAAAGCYAYAAWRRKATAHSLVDDFVLLLGALLLSADIGYIESQFHLLDHGWPRHFLIMAVVHGVTAYLFDSRTLLSLSISSLTAWLGVESRPETIFNASTETAVRMFLCAVVVLTWRFVDSKQRQSRTFEPVFDHFAANLALIGALVLTFDGDTRTVGTLLTLILAAVVIAYGIRTHSESFVLYAYVYAVLAIDIFVLDVLSGTTEILLFIVFSTTVAIVGLFALHARFRRQRA